MEVKTEMSVKMLKMRQEQKRGVGEGEGTPR